MTMPKGLHGLSRKSPGFVVEKPEQLIVSPTRIVSPVGSEVVLLGGLCGKDGRYSTKQPIEWLLSQDSVGHFVDVGETCTPRLASFLNRPPRKESSDYAITRTSTHARMITRGTAASNDDVWLKKGQGWVTITSPTAGTSHITAVAARSENWEQRRQTARIHWVDAKWVFPASTIVKAGDSHELVTTVNRASDGAPSRNWLVRYEVVGGPEIGLGPNRERAYETRTDGEGRATAVLEHSVEPGTTQVRVQVLSPTLTGSDGQPVVVGENTTTITWSAPGLAVRILGPSQAVVDSTATYRVEVSNPGDLPTSGVELAMTLGDMPVQFLSATPAPATQTDELRWELGTLQPAQTIAVNVQFRTIREANLRVRFDAAAFDARSATASLFTDVVRSSLSVTMQQVDPGRRLFVGDQVSFNVEVRNIGRTPLTNVTVQDSFDLGLRHSHGETSPIVRSLGNMAPDQVQEFAVTFTVQQPGQLCHVLEATADGGHQAATEPACVTVEQPQLDVQIQINGPQEAPVNGLAYFDITVTNTGDGQLTGLRVVNSSSASLKPNEASPGWSQPEHGVLTWDFASLVPGDSVTVAVEHSCRALDENAFNRVTVTTDEGVTHTEDAFTRIVPAQPAQGGAAMPNPPPPVQGESGLNVSLSTVSGGVKVGESVVYILDLENNTQVADRDVVVTFYLTSGGEFVSATSDGMPVTASASPDGQAISLERIRELRAGEKLPAIRFEVRAEQGPELSVKVEVTSQRSPEPVAASRETTVAAA